MPTFAKNRLLVCIVVTAMQVISVNIAIGIGVKTTKMYSRSAGLSDIKGISKSISSPLQSKLKIFLE